MAKELRITFKESESKLYDYIKEKSSPSAFLKDLAMIEKKREDLYLNNLHKPITQEENPIQTPQEVKDVLELDISDLEGLDT